MVLANRSANRKLRFWLRFLNDDAILHLSSLVGTVDLRVCTILHCYLECATLLLCHVLAFQRRYVRSASISTKIDYRKELQFHTYIKLLLTLASCASVLKPAGILEILDVLRQPIYILVSMFRHYNGFGMY